MSDEEGMDPDDSFESSGGGSFSLPLPLPPPLSLFVSLPSFLSIPSPSSFKIIPYIDLHTRTIRRRV